MDICRTLHFENRPINKYFINIFVNKLIINIYVPAFSPCNLSDKAVEMQIINFKTV